MKKKKLLIPILVVVIIAVFAGYTFAMPHHKVKYKINGTIYVLPSKFTMNLSGGQYASIQVALLLAPGQSVGTTDAKNPPPTGFGTLPEEAVIRAIITNDVTGKPERDLIDATGRRNLEHKILHDIQHQTDTKVTNVYFTDLAVQ